MEGAELSFRDLNAVDTAISVRSGHVDEETAVTGFECSYRASCIWFCGCLNGGGTRERRVVIPREEADCAGPKLVSVGALTMDAASQPCLRQGVRTVRRMMACVPADNRCNRSGFSDSRRLERRPGGHGGYEAGV